MYKANLHLRTALSILKPISKFKVQTQNALYKNVKSKAVHPMFQEFSQLNAMSSQFQPSKNDKTFDYWFVKAEEIWEQIFDNLLEANPETPLVPLSGGLDSRALLGALFGFF